MFGKEEGTIIGGKEMRGAVLGEGKTCEREEETCDTLCKNPGGYFVSVMGAWSVASYFVLTLSLGLQGTEIY